MLSRLIWGRMKQMLKITDLHTYYGSVHALKGISMQVEDGKIVTLVGSN